MFFGVVNGKVFQSKNALYIYLIKLLSKQIEIVLEHSKEIADLQAGANIQQKIFSKIYKQM